MSATVWAGLLIIGVVVGIPLLSGTRHAGTRARLFFDHPNMAGNCFTDRAVPGPRLGLPRRRPCATPAAPSPSPFLTGSNAALLSWRGRWPDHGLLHLKSRRGFVPAIAVATSLLVVLGAGAAYVVPPLVAAAEQSHAPSCAAQGAQLRERGQAGRHLRRSDRAVRARRPARDRPGRHEERAGQFLRGGGQGGPQRLPGDARRARADRAARRRDTDRGGHRADQRDHPAAVAALLAAAVPVPAALAGACCGSSRP